MFGFCFAAQTYILDGMKELNSSLDEKLKAVTVQQHLQQRQFQLKATRMFAGSTKPVVPEVRDTLPLPAGEVPNSTEQWPGPSAPGANPDFVSISTLHFTIYGYNQDLLTFLAARIEDIYQGIVTDLGLYEAAGPGAVKIYIFSGDEEYTNRSHMPAWTAGHTSIADQSVYTYESDNLRFTIPHELTHLLFNRLLPESLPDKESLWVNEGLAVYEESKNYPTVRSYYARNIAASAAQGWTLPLAKLQSLETFKKGDKDTVALWYGEAGMVVRYLIEYKDRARFHSFLMALGKFKSTDKALQAVYPTEFTSLPDIEKPLAEYLKQIKDNP